MEKAVRDNVKRTGERSDGAPPGAGGVGERGVL
jgi:hypothetical protein